MRKWKGIEAYQDARLINGGLALFCPTCPQFDINIPPESEWKEEDRYDIIVFHIKSNIE